MKNDKRTRTTERDSLVSIPQKLNSRTLDLRMRPEAQLHFVNRKKSENMLVLKS